MTPNKQVHDDLRYVRSVIDRAEVARSPATVYFLWAAITFFGFSIIDYAPKATGLFWMIAGPLGGVLSGVLGARAARTIGQRSDREGRAQALHWTGMMLTIVLLIPLEITGVLAAPEFPRVILLIVAFSYFTAGAYLDSRMMPVSIVLVGCYLLTVFKRDLPYLWTVTGSAMAVSLAAAGVFAAARARRPTSS